MFVADGRSPIALGWITPWVELGHEVHLISSYPCNPDLDLASLEVIPIAFSKAASGAGEKRPVPGGNQGIRALTKIRQWLGPLTVSTAANQAMKVIDSVRPDLVHALRIPFEGMMLSKADPPVPFIVSVWGNDFTLHATSSPTMGLHTRRVMARADALMADCFRDIRLAGQWGFPEDRPRKVLPGGGGVDLDLFNRGDPDLSLLSEPLADILRQQSDGVPTIVNPRGFRAYIRTDTFFKSIPLILERHPKSVFLCPVMAGYPEAERWVKKLGIDRAVRLLPHLTQTEMAAVYQTADVVVSPAEHDGTPNSVLEAVACGCLPIVGDLESLREWIEDGTNGLLFDPKDPHALASGVDRALEDPSFRERASVHNADLILQRAERSGVLAEAQTFYARIVDGR